MPAHQLMLQDQRSPTQANTELRRLILCGSLMAQLISSNTMPNLQTSLAKQWEQQLQKAREAGAFK